MTTHPHSKKARKAMPEEEEEKGEIGDHYEALEMHFEEYEMSHAPGS